MMAPRFLLPADGLKTESENPSFIQVKKDARTERGSPSPLTKRLGNLHAKARPLRQALYARMLINKVTEVYPEWDWESKQVMWVKIEVFPDKNLDCLLGSPSDAIKKLFPEVLKPPESQLLQNISPQDWANHVFAAYSIVIEICVASGDYKRSLFRGLLHELSLLNSVRTVENMFINQNEAVDEQGSYNMDNLDISLEDYLEAEDMGTFHSKFDSVAGGWGSRNSCIIPEQNNRHVSSLPPVTLYVGSIPLGLTQEGLQNIIGF